MHAEPGASRWGAGRAAVAVVLTGMLITGGIAPSAASAAAGSPDPAAESAAAGERQAELVAGEDRRLREALVAGLPNSDRPDLNRKPYRVRSTGALTLVLTRRRAPYTFDDLRQLSSDTLVSQGNGTFLLREHILVAEGATLQISPDQPLRIRLRSGPEGFVSLVTLGGRIQLKGTAAAPISFESWDETRGRPDTELSDGRAYLRATGRLLVTHTSFARLGFWSGRTGGLSVVGGPATEVSDLEVTSASSRPGGDSDRSVLPSGRLPGSAQSAIITYGTEIRDSSMTGNAFGLFVTGSSGAVIRRTVIRNSVVDGLMLHREVDSATVSDVRVEQSGGNGVVLSRGVEGTVLTRLVVRHSGRVGIVLAGKPRADGPSASGSSSRSFGNNVLTASESTSNAVSGVHVIGGTAIRVQGTTVRGGRAGIVVSDGAEEVEIDSNRVASVTGNGIQVRESRNVLVTGNVVRDSPTGIHVLNSTGQVRQNSTSAVTLHGITFVGRVRGSTAEKNVLSGSGTSAIDVVRTADQEGPELVANDLTGWSRTVTGDSLSSALLNPLTVVWMLIALILLTTSRPRRRDPGLPYRDDLRAPDPRTPDSSGTAAAEIVPLRPGGTTITLPRDPVVVEEITLPRDPVVVEGANRQPGAPVPVGYGGPSKRWPRPVNAPVEDRPSAQVPMLLPVPPRSTGAPRPVMPATPGVLQPTWPRTRRPAGPVGHRKAPVGGPPEPPTESDPAGSASAGSASAGLDPAGPASVGSVSAGSDPAGSVSAEPRPEAAAPGVAMIDLAIREARLNPAAPRRRRPGAR